VCSLWGRNGLRKMNLCFQGSEAHRWYQFHVLLAREARGIDDEISGFGIRCNFYALVCLVEVSEEKFMKYIEDFSESCPATHRCVERCRRHLLGRYPERIPSVTLSSVAWLSPLQIRVSVLKMAVIPSYQITVRYSALRPADAGGNMGYICQQTHATGYINFTNFFAVYDPIVCICW
jgi:hypothetical protein